MNLLDAYKAAFVALPPEIHVAEVEAENESVAEVTLRDGARQDRSYSDVTSLFVRATGEKTGFTYTQDLEEEPLAVIRRAYESSLYSAADAPEPMNGPCDGQTREDALENLEISLLWQKAEAIDRWVAAQGFGQQSRTLTVTDRVKTLGLANTLGCDVQRSKRTIEVSLLAVKAGCGSLSKVLTFSGPEELEPAMFAASLQKWAARPSAPAPFESGRYPCVLDAGVMTNILLTSWQMFTGRNYLARNTPFAGQLGETVLSPVLHLADQAARPESGHRARVDVEGTPARDVEIVQGGVLCGLLHNLSSAAAMGAAPTGNAGRKALLSGNIHTDILTIPKNFGILPGAGDAASLLARMDDGVYLYESFDEFHSINIASGDFSIPCNGIRVEHGRCTGLLDGLTINGTVQGLLRAVEAVGADLAVLPLEMLHSYAVFSPSVLVSGLEISK